MEENNQISYMTIDVSKDEFLKNIKKEIQRNNKPKETIVRLSDFANKTALQEIMQDD